MKFDHRSISFLSRWKQVSSWLLLGVVVQVGGVSPLAPALAQELADPKVEVVEPEVVEPEATKANESGVPKPVARDQAPDEAPNEAHGLADTPAILGQPVPPVVVEGPQVVYENSVDTSWKVGAKVRTGSGRATNVFLTFPVPASWPEQTVTIAAQDIPAGIGNVTSRKLASGVEQVLVQFPVLPANDIVEISYTLDVVNRAIVAPKETRGFVLPKHSKKEVKPFLAVSKNVDHNNSKLRKQAKEIIADHETAWEQVEAIYDWVRQNIQIQDTQYHSARHTLKNLSGSNEDKTFLFVALCRSVKIPSRIVFAKAGASYAEFMLAGPESEPLHWFPCDVSGIREFGGLSEPRMILQKGDGIKVPEKKHPQKYVAEFMSCSGNVKPRVGFFRAEIFENEPPK